MVSFLTSIIKIYEFIRSVSDRINKHCVSAFSGQASLFLIISFFPFFMFLLTLIRYLPISEAYLLKLCTEMVPPTFNSLIISVVKEIYSKATNALISVTAVTALWSASRGFLSIIKGFNRIYDIEETRSYIRVRIMAIFYTLVFALLLIAILVVLVFGNRLYHYLLYAAPLLGNLLEIISTTRTILGLGLLFIFFILIYIFIPNRKSSVLQELPGAAIASVCWVGFSYLFSIYIDHFSNYSYTYGSLTGIVLLMVWLYSCMYILFLGGELNSILHEWRMEKPFV